MTWKEPLADRPSAGAGRDRSVLIIVENQPYLTDTRVKAEASTLHEAGWRVHVICPDPSSAGREGGPLLYQHSEIDGIHVHSYRMDFASSGLPGYLKEYLNSLFHIARLSLKVFRRDGFSVVHLCNPPDVLFVVGALFKFLGRKVVFDHHDLFPEMVLSRHRGLAQRLLFQLSRILEFLTFRTADVVLSTNQSYRRVAIGRGRISEADVFVVRNGPRVDEITSSVPDPTLKRGFPYMACYAGIMGPEDGVRELMQVIRHIVLQKGRSDILFCLLGDGAARSEAVAFVQASGIQRFVDMPGMILDRSQFFRYLATADLMLAPELSNPHNDKSTFIKIAEYMAVGKPIAAYDLAESRYTAGEAAIYVPSGNMEAYAEAIVGLLDDPGQRALMGELGIERIKTRFQWERQKENLLRAYARVMHKGRGGA